MKAWLAFVIGAGLCWGTYVPLIAYGGKSLGTGQAGIGNRLAAILCVGGAYLVLAVLVPVAAFFLGGPQTQNVSWNASGITFSSLAGAAGAVGAICVVFATAVAEPGDRIYIAPLIFALAPVINTLFSLVWQPTKDAPYRFAWPTHVPDWKLWVGIVLTGVGAALVLYAKETAEVPLAGKAPGVAAASPKP